MSKRQTKRDSKGRPKRHQPKSISRGKLLSPEEPDVSSILKVPGAAQTEEPDDLFDHPLHSTAVSFYEEEGAGKYQYSEPDGSTSNSSDSEPEQRNTVGSKNCHTLKSRVQRKKSEEEPMIDNMVVSNWVPVRKDRRAKVKCSSTVDDCKLPSTTRSARNSSLGRRISDRMADFVKNVSDEKVPRKSAKSNEKQKEASPETDEDCLDDPHLIKVWVPKGLRKIASQVTESDVILDAFGRITEKYKQEVESNICREAIDNFYAGFRDHLTNAITDAEELKNAKLKNAKMVRTTNKKRQRLIDVKEELIRTEPQLKKLERESAKLKENIYSLRNAIQLVTDLKDLQEKYVSERKEHSEEKIIYGVSSLPALLVESRRILGAEGHFRNINAELQQALDLQKKN